MSVRHLGLPAALSRDETHGTSSCFHRYPIACRFVSRLGFDSSVLTPLGRAFPWRRSVLAALFGKVIVLSFLLLDCRCVIGKALQWNPVASGGLHWSLATWQSALIDDVTTAC